MMTSRSALMIQLCTNKSSGVCSKHEEKDELSESGKLTDRTDPNNIEHNEESIEKYHANDLVKKWLDNNDFSHLPGPENVHNLENGTESISLESLCLQNNIELSAVCNESIASTSFCMDTANSQTKPISTDTSNRSKEIKILSNIVICESKVDSEIIDESVDDDSCDKDFNILDFTQSNTSTSGSDKIDCNYKSCFENECLAGLTIDDNINDEVIFQPLSDVIKEKRTYEKEVVRCIFCEEDVSSKNYMRHLARHHGSEKEVEEVLKLPTKSKARRQALILLRKKTNFGLYISGTMRPCRKSIKGFTNNFDYYPCIYCKGVFLKRYLKRHGKVCISKPHSVEQIRTREDHISNSHTMVACSRDPTDTISQLNVREQVFDKMRGDEVSFVAKTDLLIAHFGETFLKKHKRERMIYVCSNRMRELARLLISYRNLTNNAEISFKDLLHPKNFDIVLSAARNVVGYDPLKKTFKSPSLAMHIGTSLKLASDELSHLILKEDTGFKCKTSGHISEWLKNVKNFKKLIESRWNSELASLANKDLQEKRWNKPLLLPLVNDIKIFRDECLKIAVQCTKIFTEEKDDIKTYTLLVNCTLALLIVFNRRRIGDVQFLKIADYEKDHRSNFVDFENALTKTEKMLATKYKRVLNSGKGSRAVVLLIPENLQNYIDLLLTKREKYISAENDYVFAVPGSKVQWGKGDIAIRSLARKMNLQNPQTISSNKLRKHIATVMQILNLTKDETKQFSQFMGHTQKTHEEFYELPVDIYQTAKVSKLLLMVEKGIPIEHKGKSLADINFNINLEYAEESDDDDNGVIPLSKNLHVNPEETLQLIANDQPERKDNNKTSSADSSEPDEMVFLGKKRSQNKRRKMDITQNCITTAGNFEEFNRHKKTTTKRAWSTHEIAALKREFATFIKIKKYPSAEEIKDFIKKTHIERSATIIKSKLQHLYKLSSVSNL